MKRNYVITYDIADDEIIKEKIKSLGSWMSYFPKTYIINTDIQTAKEIYGLISTGYEKNRILIIELDKSNYWGVLPTKAWDWFREKKRQPKNLIK